MARDIQAAVRRPEEKGIVAFVPDVKARAFTAASVSQCTSAVLLGRKRISRAQSSDRSTTDAVAGGPRSNGHLPLSVVVMPVGAS